jgi:hypothetical protein
MRRVLGNTLSVHWVVLHPRFPHLCAGLTQGKDHGSNPVLGQLFTCHRLW